MKKKYISFIVGLIAVGLLTGCAPKEVEYEGSSSNDQNKSTKTDNKLDQIQGEEQTIEVNNDESSSNSIDSNVETNIDNSSTTNGINSVNSDIGGQTVTLNSVHFNFDKFNLTDEMREIATENANKINTTSETYNNLKIKLEGNCDEWGTDEYNYALGLKRAKTAKDALIADGVDESKIMLVSFGESNPICTDRNVACWKLNRRVDYRLLP
ncbi:MAG: OmpA family protein [Campylobacterota bacterium]|nr:OmpA family protein [Campylobacterota bacterium]